MASWGLILGFIGTLTGVAGTILGVLNFLQNRPNIKIGSFTCKINVHKNNTNIEHHLYLEMDIKNKGNKASTLEEVSLDINNHILNPEIDYNLRIEKPNLPTDINANSSQALHFSFKLTENQFNFISNNPNQEVKLSIKQTHGYVRKKLTNCIQLKLK